MSSFVIASPDFQAAAAAVLAEINETIGAANAAAASSTTQVLAAASDEVSATIAKLFCGYGYEYQALSAQAAVFHAQFVRALNAGAGAYAAAEAANASSVQPRQPLQVLQRDVLAAVNAPTQVLLGRPLIGNGADATAPGQSGGNGGILYGNGGAGYTSTTPGVAGTNGGAAGLIGNG
ncbi:PE family protein, partial [Mycobacterium riyadhense]